MFCSQVAKHARFFLLKKNSVNLYPLVILTKSFQTPNSWLSAEWNRSFSVTNSISEETNEHSHKKLLDTRSSEDEKKVKQYLSLINGCDLRKFYYADETKKLLDNNIILLPGELSSCISYMYRIGLSKLVLQVFRYYDHKGLFGLLNVNSIKYIMLCCVKEKDTALLHHVYETLNSKRKNSIVLNSTYIRCLLSVNELTAATSLLGAYLSNPIYKNSSVLSKNDIYSNVIAGFYEGKYYSRCLKAFHSLRPDMPLIEKKKQAMTVNEANWKSVQNSLCYSAVIGSYYRLKQNDAVIQYYNECRAFSLFPSFHEAMMVAQAMADSDDYKLIYDELLTKKNVLRGIPDNEKERYLLNLSKINQTKKALRQVYWNWYYYRNQKPKTDHDTKTINVYTGDNEDVGNCLELLATLYDLKALMPKNSTSAKVIVKTGSNATSLEQMISYLEHDLYPLLPYEVDVNRIVINVADAQMWVKTRRNLSLELR